MVSGLEGGGRIKKERTRTSKAFLKGIPPVLANGHGGRKQGKSHS